MDLGLWPKQHEFVIFDYAQLEVVLDATLEAYGPSWHGLEAYPPWRHGLLDRGGLKPGVLYVYRHPIAPTSDAEATTPVSDVKAAAPASALEAAAPTSDVETVAPASALERKGFSFSIFSSSLLAAVVVAGWL
ncbi:hypothetical protein QJS10_CPB21g00676 [Acorus calamus]|uniref:Uncharacterized protein n=1 Tax=Acorus calamus TaxID=4465 RepID=A0AAV9C8B5_ACOCL|nr:hypothetical protein QJS10_CPB21g00676 [Acorus calamus]